MNTDQFIGFIAGVFAGLAVLLMALSIYKAVDFLIRKIFFKE